MTDAQTSFDRYDQVILDIEAEFPENVIVEATISIPDPSVSGRIRPLQPKEES